MKKRWLATLMCGILAMAALAGCGDTGKDGPTVYTSNIVKQPQQQTSEQESTVEGEESNVPGETESSQENTTQENTAQEAEDTMKDISPMELVEEMKIGWNLGNTLDAVGNQKGPETERVWGNPKTTQEMIDAVIDQGFNVIRIPVTWDSHMGEAPEYEVWPAWMDRVQEAASQ